mgnify:CR=1 FL=1
MLTILAPLLLSAPQVSESWTATGPIGEPFGQVVASAGHRAWEIARQEILVGSPLQDGAGQLTILSPFGSTSLFFEGPIPGSLLGYAVADAGDLDGDGLAEFFVSAPGMRRSGVDSGMVAAMSSLSRQPLWIRSGQQAGWLWGESLGSIGDLDGDSHREMMVASTYVDAVGTRAGRVEILSGRKGTSLRLHEGVGAGARTGAAMASLGDLDGDGVEDYLIGSPGESTLGYKQGSVRLYSGATGAELQLLGREDRLEATRRLAQVLQLAELRLADPAPLEHDLLVRRVHGDTQNAAPRTRLRLQLRESIDGALGHKCHRPEVAILLAVVAAQPR